MLRKTRYERYKPAERFTVFDMEMVRLILTGGSVIDLNRLDLSPSEISAFCRVQQIDFDDLSFVALVERIRDEAVVYLREVFSFPIPRPVRQASLTDLLSMASDSKNRHRQFCACVVLKAMHIINHFDANEARQALVMTDQEVFKRAEQNIYHMVSRMMADGLPIVEFLGGRKRRAAMVTKLLSKQNPLSAQLFDKMRFRVVTTTRDDIIPMINFLARNMFPFNYVLAGESYNTLLPFLGYSQRHPYLSKLLHKLQPSHYADAQDDLQVNQYSSPEFKVVHWVADMPLRIPDYENAYHTDGVNPVPRPILYVRVELQILDRRSFRQNEAGHASHEKYKMRQLEAIASRIRVGAGGVRGRKTAQ